MVFDFFSLVLRWWYWCCVCELVCLLLFAMFCHYLVLLVVYCRFTVVGAYWLDGARLVLLPLIIVRLVCCALAGMLLGFGVWGCCLSSCLLTWMGLVGLVWLICCGVALVASWFV